MIIQSDIFSLCVFSKIFNVLSMCLTTDEQLNCTNLLHRQIKVFVLENCKIRKKCKT
jgi:hypothetical protein